MKSKWKVTTNIICGEKYYGVYRIRDTSEVDHSGNRENYGEYTTDKAKAQELADCLKATLDILRDESKAILSYVKSIEVLYLAAADAEFSIYRNETANYERLLSTIPERMWLE